MGVVAAAILFPPEAGAQERPRFRLDTVRVEVGSRLSVELPVRTRSVEVLNREEIDALPARTVAELLRWTTGVDLQSRSPVSHDLALRGGGFEEVLVLVDGARASDAQTGHFDLDLAVPLDRVERIEILRGPASATYGADAVGGVVNIVTRPVEGWTARLEGGNQATWGGALTGGLMTTGGTRLSLSTEAGRSDGHREGTDYETRTVHATLRSPLGVGELALDLGAAWREFGAAFFYASNPAWDEFERTRTQTLTVGWTRPAHRGLVLEPRVTVRRHEDTFLLIRNNPSFYRNRHVGWQVGAEVAGRHQGPGPLVLGLGVDASADLLRSNNLGDREEGRGGITGEVVWTPDAATVLQLGLRGDLHDRWGGVISPSLSASRWLGGDLRLRGSFGRSFRAPSFTDRYYVDPANVGDPDLRPERAWTVDAGADWSPLPALSLGLTGFVRHGRDLIDWARPLDAGPEVPWVTRNVEEARTRGIELDALVNGPGGVVWTSGATLLSLHLEETGAFRSKSALRPLTETLRGGVRAPLGPVTVSLQGTRAKRLGEDPWIRLDSRLLLQVGARSTLYLDASNLTDAIYPDPTGLSAPGRTLVVGIRARSPGAP